MNKKSIVCMLTLAVLFVGCAEKVTINQVFTSIKENNIDVAVEDYNKLNEKNRDEIDEALKELIDNQYSEFLIGNISRGDALVEIIKIKKFDGIIEYADKTSEKMQVLDESRRSFEVAKNDEEKGVYDNAIKMYRLVDKTDTENYEIAQQKIQELKIVMEEQEQQEKQEQEAEKQFVLGETKNCKELIELRFDSYEWMDQILPTNISGSYSYIGDIEGESYFVIKGEVKNISSNTVNISRALIEFKFNDNYNYFGNFTAEGKDKSDFLGENIAPLTVSTCYLYVSVPDEIREKYKNCEIIYGFSNLNNIVTTESECKAVYKLETN